MVATGKAPKGNRCVRERAYDEAAAEGGEEAMTTDQSACPICRRGTPTDVVAELDSSWVTMSASAPLRGYACLVFRRHAVELHDLSHSEGVAFMSDIRRLSGAVKGVTGAAKMNYEVHGNTIQHLHMHFYPRYPNDVFHGGPISPKAVTAPVYAAGEIKDFQTRLRQALGL
jgi:diadenosine tetraphosphate (Ap4A) HIT family hydrolase